MTKIGKRIDKTYRNICRTLDKDGMIWRSKIKYELELLKKDLTSLQEPIEKKTDKCPGCGVEGIGCICAILNPIS